MSCKRLGRLVAAGAVVGPWLVARKRESPMIG